MNLLQQHSRLFPVCGASLGRWYLQLQGASIHGEGMGELTGLAVVKSLQTLSALLYREGRK